MSPAAEGGTEDTLAEKLAYWRKNGLNARMPKAMRDQRDTTVREQARLTVEQARANGYDPVPAADKYRWV